MSRHLFTTEPLPKPPQGYVPLARAMICVDCESIAYMGSNCANCASEQVMPLEAWLRTMR